MKIELSIRTRRKLERFRREAIIYGLALCGFIFMMYLITSESVRNAVAAFVP